MSKIVLSEPDGPYSATIDTDVMAVEIQDAYTGVSFLSPAGEKLSVCMRDNGFEIRYYKLKGEKPFDNRWVELKDGVVIFPGGKRDE